MVHAQSNISTFGIPQNAFGAIVVSGTKIRNNPNLKDLPFELMELEHQGKYGIDIFKIQQNIITLFPNQPGKILPSTASVCKFIKKPNLRGQNIQDTDPVAGFPAKIFKDKTYSVLLIDDTTLLFLPRGGAAKDFTKTSDGSVANLMKQAASEPWDALVVLDTKEAMKTYGDRIKGGLAAIPLLPAAVKRLIPLLDEMQSAEIRLRIDPYELKLTCRFADAETATKNAKAIKRAVEFGAEMGLGVTATQLDVTEPTQAAAVSYVERLIEQIPNLQNFKIDGKELSMTFKDEEMVFPAAAYVAFFWVVAKPKLPQQ